MIAKIIPQALRGTLNLLYEKRNIAVIGAGISGLSAAWLLSKKHNVTVFEKDEHAGGHANTRSVSMDAEPVHVDSGFIVYNEKNYPNLTSLFTLLEVPTCDIDMSFAFSRNNGQYEYNGSGLRGLFGQKSNMISKNHWRMIKDIHRFFKESRHKISGYEENIKLSKFLEMEGFSKPFLNDHILPMAGAIWSSPVETMKLFPARSFLDFYSNHGLLQATNRPQWRSIIGGSREYVRRLIDDGQFDLQLNSAIASVLRDSNGVTINLKNGQTRHFDEVVFGCHADTALAMLENPSKLEQQLLGNFSYSNNLAIMHTDETQMPKRRKLWASWNYLTQGEQFASANPCSVTYWMNNLQKLTTEKNIFVSINPRKEIDPSKILFETQYDHPIFDAQAVNAQKMLWELQGANRSWFCGSYFGYGFHEDGLQSGLAVAEQLGGMRRPWSVENESSRIHLGSSGLMKAAE